MTEKEEVRLAIIENDLVWVKVSGKLAIELFLGAFLILYAAIGTFYYKIDAKFEALDNKMDIKFDVLHENKVRNILEV